MLETQPELVNIYLCVGQVGLGPEGIPLTIQCATNTHIAHNIVALRQLVASLNSKILGESNTGLRVFNEGVAIEVKSPVSQEQIQGVVNEFRSLLYNGLDLLVVPVAQDDMKRILQTQVDQKDVPKGDV